MKLVHSHTFRPGAEPLGRAPRRYGTRAQPGFIASGGGARAPQLRLSRHQCYRGSGPDARPRSAGSTGRNPRAPLRASLPASDSHLTRPIRSLHSKACATARFSPAGVPPQCVAFQWRTDLCPQSIHPPTQRVCTALTHQRIARCTTYRTRTCFSLDKIESNTTAQYPGHPTRKHWRAYQNWPRVCLSAITPQKPPWPFCP